MQIYKDDLHSIMFCNDQVQNTLKSKCDVIIFPCVISDTILPYFYHTKIKKLFEKVNL